MTRRWQKGRSGGWLDIKLVEVLRIPLQLSGVGVSGEGRIDKMLSSEVKNLTLNMIKKLINRCCPILCEF